MKIVRCYYPTNLRRYRGSKAREKIKVLVAKVLLVDELTWQLRYYGIVIFEFIQKETALTRGATSKDRQYYINPAVIESDHSEDKDPRPSCMMTTAGFI